MTGDYWIINSEQKLKNFKEFLDGAWEANHWLQVQVKTGKTRTVRQNAALHAWFRDLAKELNKRGIDYKHFFTRFDFGFTEYSVKDHVWRPVQAAIVGHDETSKLERNEVSEVYDVINRKLADHGIHIPLGKEFTDAISSTAGPETT